MPSNRFLKLPEGKRNKFLKAVHAELTEFPVNELSINRIIRRADISRGSFYQYFKNKEDLLEYVFSDFKQTVMDEIIQSLQRNQGDIFEVGIETLQKIITVGSRDENRRVFVNVFSYISVAQDSLQKALANENVLVESLIRYIDRDRLKYSSDDEIREIIRLGLAVFKDSVCRSFADIDNASVIIDNFRMRMEILKYGIRE